MPINFETGRSTRTWESSQYTSAMCAFHHPPIIFPDQNTSTRHPNKAPEMVVSYVFFFNFVGRSLFLCKYIYFYIYVCIYIYHTSLEKWLRKLCVGMSCIQVYGRSLNAYCVVQGLLLRKAGPAPGKMRDRGRVVTLRQSYCLVQRKQQGGLFFWWFLLGKERYS